MATHPFKEQYEKYDAEADRLLDAANAMNYQDFTKGDEYNNLSQQYTDRGNKAMENTLAQVSARTGGLASSYATRASQNSYNDYMSQLEDAARSLYGQRLNEKQEAYQLARSNADDYYSRWMQEQQLAASKSRGYGYYPTSNANENNSLNSGIDRNKIDSVGAMSGGDYTKNTMDNISGWTSTASQNTTGYGSWMNELQRIYNRGGNMSDVVNQIQMWGLSQSLSNELYNKMKEYALTRSTKQISSSGGGRSF